MILSLVYFSLIKPVIDLGRYCLPNATAASDYIVKKFGNGDVGRYMGDI